MAVKISNCGQSAGKTLDVIENIPPDVGWYLSGFTDGEGSFNISLVNRNRDYKSGWKVVASFNISQKDPSTPYLFQKVLGCGTIRYRKDGICYFEVTNAKDWDNRVRPFFERFPMRSHKQETFKRVSAVVRLLLSRKHLMRKGMEEILALRDSIIVGRKRKYSTQQVLNSFRESSETIRQTPQLRG